MGLAPSKFAIWQDREIQKWVGEDFGEVWKKGGFWKLLGMGWPGVGNVPRACGSILHLSRGSQEPYKKYFLVFLYNSRYTAPGGHYVRLSVSLL